MHLVICFNEQKAKSLSLYFPPQNGKNPSWKGPNYHDKYRVEMRRAPIYPIVEKRVSFSPYLNKERAQASTALSYHMLLVL